MLYLFLFGNSPQLSHAELRAVLQRSNFAYKIEFSAEFGDLVNFENDSLVITDISKLLGGTIKVVKVEKELSQDSKLETEIVDILHSGESKVTFGVSFVGTGVSPLTAQKSEICGNIKDELERMGHKVRFVLSKPGEPQLSSVVVAKQKISDLFAIGQDGNIYLGKTVWVQDFVDWGKRDYDRPAVSGHIGMLPPKVARMMANLSGGGLILDPFCGVGTVLMEAMMIGCKTIGSDLDPKQVESSKANLEWFTKSYNLQPTTYKIFQADARNIGNSLKGERVDAIVTEPDLGPNNPRAIWPPGVKERLSGMYMACLQSWTKVLKPGGRVVIALPKVGDDDSIVAFVIDKARSMGYSLSLEPVEYSRPQAVIKREICVFVLN